VNYGYRTFIAALLLGLPFGIDPVTDTLNSAIDIDYVWGKADYYTGCMTPSKTIYFNEMHAGYRAKVNESITLQADAGVIPTSIEPVDDDGGGKNTFVYIAGNSTVNWEYFGFAMGLANISPYFSPYIRLGSRNILFIDAGIAHHFPLGSAGVENIGVGTGFGSGVCNLWAGRGADINCGGLNASEFYGWSVLFDCRITDWVTVRLGGLRSEGNAQSTWLGLRFNFK